MSPWAFHPSFRRLVIPVSLLAFIAQTSSFSVPCPGMSRSSASVVLCHEQSGGRMGFGCPREKRIRLPIATKHLSCGCHHYKLDAVHLPRTSNVVQLRMTGGKSENSQNAMFLLARSMFVRRALAAAHAVCMIKVSPSMAAIAEGARTAVGGTGKDGPPNGMGMGGFNGFGARGGQELVVSALRQVLKDRGITSVLDLNENQQLLVEAWSIITSFYMDQDFRFTPGRREGWTKLLCELLDLKSLQGPEATVAAAQRAISEVLLPALGDQYSQFFSPEEWEQAEVISEGGKAVGFGAVFVLPPRRSREVREAPVVVSVVPSSSAERQGLQIGDRLVMVNGKKVSGRDGVDPGDFIFGPVGSTASATLRTPGGAEYSARLERVLMSFQPVRAELLPPASPADAKAQPACLATQPAPTPGGSREGRQGRRAGSRGRAGSGLQTECSGGEGTVRSLYLRIDTFAGPPVGPELRRQVGRLAGVGGGGGRGGCEGGPTGVVLDVRGNSGGRLTQAEEAAAALQSLNSSPPPAYVVLVDEATASAAEALVLRLFEAKRQGTVSDVAVVGARGARRTFGKGVSQQAFELSDGSAVMVTVSRWAPAGFDGIDVDVVLSEAESEDAVGACARKARQMLACAAARP